MGTVQVGRLVTSMDGQTKVFPIDFALEGPSIGSRTALGPHLEILRTIASSSRRPVGATGAVGVHAAQACSYCRTVPSAEIPCCPRCRHLQVSSWLPS